jgi:DNA-binding transcriptional LysR family regulator
MLDELVLIVSPTHAWARRRDVTPESLADEPLLVREEGSATRSVTERALQRVKFRVAMELDHTEAIKQGVIAGLGVLVSLYAVQGEVAPGGFAPSGCEGFAFSGTSTSFTTRPGESRRAHGRSCSYSSRRHAKGGGG